MSDFLDPDNQRLMNHSAFEHNPVSAIIVTVLVSSAWSAARWVRRKVCRV